MAAQIGSDLANVPFDKLIKNLLLAMVSAQNEANKSFVDGITDLINDPVDIKWTNASDATRSGEIKGPAIAFGILPTLLAIQSGIIEIKMAISMSQKTDISVGVQAHMDFGIGSASVDAKYSNSYSYSVDASSFIHIQVAPVPPPQALMTIINAIAQNLAPPPPPLPPKV